MDPNETHRCSICQREYRGWGNNAAPVNHGRCCDDCNSLVVIPARLNEIRERSRTPPPGVSRRSQ